ncbi:unnamed protein product [Dibothriocephalus latus]|uniref:Protein tweety homolog n=1 Tax=Dibothriocephalus latus TaxID=60516 RepID=A0A3P7LDC4_DIBLA|nr:unnamed protein product [Dibothriocephalus latus]
MIIPSVLGCVAMAFAWMLQYQNGGLLNVVMKPVRSQGSSNVTFEIISDFSGLSTQVMNIVWGKLTKADLAVLEALPVDLGGGEQGVNQAIAHPNNEGKLIVAFIVCLVFASLGLVAIFVVSLICCCCCSSGSHGDSSNNDQNFLCCGLHILGFVMTALLLVGLAVCIGYYFGAANAMSETLANSKATDAEVIVWLRGNSSSFSIGRIMEFLVSNVRQFASTSIQSAKTNVNMTINNLTKHLLEGTLPNEISTLVTAIAVEFKVAEIIQEANKMVYAIGNATENSDFISTNYTSIVLDIVTNATLLNTTLDSVKPNCGPNYSQAATLRNDFDPSKVLPVHRNVTEVFKKTYTQLKKLQSQLENVTNQLETMQKNVVDELQKQLDFQKMLSSMNDLMDGLDKQVVQAIEQLNQVTTKVSGYLGEYSGTAKAALYALCLPCLLAGILFLVFLALYLFGALKRHLFSLTGNSAAEGTFYLVFSERT